MLLLALVLGSQAFANTATTVTTTEAKPESKSKNSKQNRENVNYSIQMGSGLLISEASTIFEINYIRNSKTTFSLRYAKADDIDLDINKQDAILLGAKNYTGNSFFVRPEVYYRKFKEEVRPELFSNRTETRVYSDIGVSLSIGNEWQWENFTAGFDWIGIAGRVAKLEDNNKRSWLDTEADEQFEVNVLNFRLGYSF